jgi:hypothetical protein
VTKNYTLVEDDVSIMGSSGIDSPVLFNDELHFINCGWVYHFNAIPQNDRHVSYWMERSYKQLYS